MFLARDEKGDLVNSLEDDLVKQDYTCPACRSIVQLRRGQNKRSHFAHQSLKNCQLFHENESPEHLGNKQALFYWAKKDDEVSLEFPISQCQQIADILVEETWLLKFNAVP